MAWGLGRKDRGLGVRDKGLIGVESSSYATTAVSCTS